MMKLRTEDSATQLLIKYKSGALITQIDPVGSTQFCLFLNMCLKIYYRIWGVYTFLKIHNMLQKEGSLYRNIEIYKGMEGWGVKFDWNVTLPKGPLPICKCVSERLICPYNSETRSPVSTLRCSPIQSERPDWLEPAARAKPPPLDQDYHDYVADVGDHLSIRRPQGKKSAMVFHSRRGGGKTTSSQGPAWLTKGQKSILQAKVYVNVAFISHLRDSDCFSGLFH